MKNKYFAPFLLGLAGLLLVAGFVLAQDEPAINYPVQELGGCKDKADCKTFCDKPENSENCLSFAQQNNLMSEKEVKIAKKFVSGEMNGPGGCKTKDACEEYCNDMAHINECVSFAEKNDILPPKELEEAKKVKAAIAKGVRPPPCGNKKSCDIYCEDPSHMEECITFATEAGFMQGKELEDAQKMLQAVKRGVKPPPCKGKDACDEFCSNPDNMEVCMKFAIEAGMMPEEERQGAQKMLEAIKKGVKPPKCRGKEECDAYCQQDEHIEECINFSIAAGMMDAKDAEMAKKTKGKGPGGCKGKEECDAFCKNPDNQETCFNFAKDNGLISEDEMKKMNEGKRDMQKMLQEAPQEVADCLASQVGGDIVEKMKNGTGMPSEKMGRAMEGCFQKMGPKEGEGRGGPGGCKSPEECDAYCKDHQEECQKFRPEPGEQNPGNQMMPQQAGPGGCKGPEECKSFCESNPEQCKNFQPQNGPRPEDSRPENQMMPPRDCQGENCRPPENQMMRPEDMRQPQDFRQMQGPSQDFRPQDGQMMQRPENFQPPAGDQNFRPPENQMMRPDQQPQPMPQPGTENLPPPPPPPPPPAEQLSPVSRFINTDSFVGSLIDAVFQKFLLRK